jgi:hypothetical protein
VIKEHHRVHLVEQFLQEVRKQCESKGELKESEYGIEEVKGIECYKYFFSSGNQSDILTLPLEVKTEKKKRKKKKKKKRKVKVSTEYKSGDELSIGSEAEELTEAIIRECSLGVNIENDICDINNTDHTNESKEILEKHKEQNNNKTKEVKVDEVSKEHTTKKDTTETQHNKEVKKANTTQQGNQLTKHTRSQ